MLRQLQVQRFLGGEAPIRMVAGPLGLLDHPRQVRAPRFVRGTLPSTLGQPHQHVRFVDGE
jgi:hypothetical protein